MTVEDKHGNTIDEGDRVFTKIRGGKREGEVENIVTTKEEAAEEKVKNPPKGIKPRTCVLGSNAKGFQLSSTINTDIKLLIIQKLWRIWTRKNDQTSSIVYP
ncbi:phosphatidylserine decarboxylase protein [Rutstroemia sp. NJR-2017a BVV2]|nr:phosphatidylserine decarboxylase protein [Rutstroemia sp. NJR-2017a BVV2]